eukprot:CAMPEP_0170070906 /NCGR_PEP_ID=MMETSP0019_2-20121128/9029_1 /TAXON_ID=98059 /ORGANISM="Dinobryon sp., Strain UTEXLB2267" /LENGTH=490 /DNA_ID=CAMNT_0010279315 /DNA_START=280 /DNA_END=1752 /DNA_ORIENTATION=-
MAAKDEIEAQSMRTIKYLSSIEDLVEQSQLSQQSHSMSAAQSQILFDISYNLNNNSATSTHTSRSGDYLLSAIHNEMINPLNKSKTPSVKISNMEKYRNKAIAHFATYPKPSSNQPPVDIHIENVSDFLQSFDVVYNQNPKTLKWLHIFDLSCLESVVRKFDLHEIVETTFRDVRPHCSFIETVDGFIASTSHCIINSNDHASFYKLYIYVAPGENKNIVITYENRNSDLGVYNCLRVRDEDPIQKRAFYNKYSTFGAVYLLYDILLTASNLQQPLIQQCCKYVSFNKQYLFSTTTLRISEYSHMHKRIRSVETCLLLIERLLVQSNKVINKLDLISPAIYKMLSNESNEDYSTVYLKTYLMALSDCYDCELDFVKKEILHTRTVYEDMANITSTRQNRTNVILSLVATVFLPLTFLTGVFGMNFQLHAEYSMPILNDPNGPIYFAWLSVAITILIYTYFASNGWITFIFSPRKIKKFWKWIVSKCKSAK